MLGCFFLFELIVFLLEIIMICRKKNAEIIYANFVALGIAYFELGTSGSYGLNEIVVPFLIYAFLIFINIILFIIGLVKKIIIGDKFKPNAITIVLSIIIIITSIIITIVIPKLIDASNYANSGDRVIKYLNKKYGNHNFKTASAEKNYSYNGFVSAVPDGYELTISTDLLSDVSTVYENDYGINEFIVKDYYNEKINKFLQDKQARFSTNIKAEKIPDSLGHIPTINELDDFNAIDYLIIESKYEYTNEEYLINYLKDIAFDLQEYLKITNEIEFEYRSLNKNDTSTVSIWMSSKKVIINYNNNYYTFEIKEKEVQKKLLT